jgi:hypothetical protein
MDRRFEPLVLAGLVLAGFVLAACGPADDASPTAEEIVNVWFEPSWGAAPGEKARFCSAYERNPERTRDRFTAEFEEVEGNPTAREILDEAASRC